MPRTPREYESGVEFPRNRLLTLKEVGAVLGLKYHAARKLVVVGALPVVRMAGQTMRVRPRDLERFISAGGLDYAPIPRRHQSRAEVVERRRARLAASEGDREGVER